MDFKLIILASLAEGRVIGNKGKIPWSFKADRDNFRDKTRGNALIAGRKAFESLEILPGREYIVLTNNREYDAKGEAIVFGLDEAIRASRFISDVAYIIGGEGVYRQAISNPLVTRLELTEIHRVYPGDAFFPDYSHWTETSRKDSSFTRRDGEEVKFSFVDYER